MSTEEDDAIGSALFGRTPPDLTPLLNLLRSNRPVSQGIRDMLAEMIDPAKPGYLYLRFELEDAEGKVRNHTRDLRTLSIARHHAELVSSGKSANQAAIETGQEYGMDPRRVYTRLAEAKQLGGWLRAGRGPTDRK